jgi:hypothetical protein
LRPFHTTSRDAGMIWLSVNFMWRSSPSKILISLL